MKPVTASVLLVLLAVCAVSAEEETFLSSSISYVQDVAGDVANKATDTLNQVKELPIAQQAMDLYDSGATYVSSVLSSVQDYASNVWEKMTKSF